LKTWFTYIKQGLARKLPDERLGGHSRKRGFSADIQNIYPYLKKHWRKGMLGIILVVITALLALPPPLITRYLIDDVILARQLEPLLGALILLIGILVIEKTLRFLETFYFARFEQRITLEIQNDLISRVLRWPKAVFDDQQTGYLLSRLSEDVDGIRTLFSSSMVQIASNFIRFVGGIGFLMYLEWRMSLIVLILLPGLGFLVRYFSAKIHVLSHQKMEQKGRALSDFQESVSETTLIKSFVAENHTQKRLMAQLKRLFHISMEQTSVNALAGVVINSMPGIARLMVLAVGAVWVINGQWTLGSLLAYQAYITYVFGPAQLLASTNLQLQEARAALERVNDLFDIVPEDNSGVGRQVRRLNGDIEFRNVTFGYHGSDPVLKDISMRVRPAEKVAIVGPSGVGKTTLLSLILGFYRPTEGQVFFDGLPAAEYEIGSLRRRIGYVSQQPRLLTGSIMQNLLYGNPDVNAEKVKQIAKIAGIQDFIEQLPEGYDTQIREGGANFSEGQKQRLSIARALVKAPDIIIFDEPTAALDGDAEASLFEALPEVITHKTMFVVTHRPSTIRQAERVFMLNENQLIEISSDMSLLESDTDYLEMLANPGFR
jgi:ABC-type bacteriocin/lantibiotic exporter with double-glycine peptidase domain